MSIDKEKRLSGFLNLAFNRTVAKIKSGYYGRAGERFFTTKQLSDDIGISLVSAQKIMVCLRERGLIELIGKKHYLTYSTVMSDTELGGLKINSGIIGVHFSSLENIYFSQLANEVIKSGKNAGFSVFVSTSDGDAEEEKKILSLFRSIGADGIISCPGTDASLINLYDSLPVPYVFLSKTVPGVEASSVLVNNFASSEKVAQYLIEIGYEAFYYIGIKEYSEANDYRLAGFRSGLEAGGFTEDNLTVHHISKKDIGVFGEELTIILKNIKTKAAIFCYHDLIAADIVNQCRLNNISIPEDISVVGFDDLDCDRTSLPFLTTMSYKTDEMARSAIMLLDSKIRGKTDNTTMHIEPQLIIRGSTEKGK